MKPEFVMAPRNQGIADAIEDYANGKLSYDELERKIAAMGYKTTSLFGMVRDIKVKDAWA